VGRQEDAGVENAAAASRTANTLLVTSSELQKLQSSTGRLHIRCPWCRLCSSVKSFAHSTTRESGIMSADAPSFADGSGFGSGANGSNAGKKAVHVKVR
jgi:hypothetical protein